MEFRILGPVEAVSGDGQPAALGPRQSKLLAVLLLAGSKTVPVEGLIDALWDDRPPATARRQIYNGIWMLRQRLNITADGPGYRINLDRSQVDLHVFEDRVAQAGVLAGDGCLAEAADMLTGALRLWRGPALAGITGRVIDAAAARLEEQRLNATEDCLDLRLQLGHHHNLVSDLTGLVAAHPLRERLTGQLMLALHRCGRQPDALAAYQRIRIPWFSPLDTGCLRLPDVKRGSHRRLNLFAAAYGRSTRWGLVVSGPGPIEPFW